MRISVINTTVDEVACRLYDNLRDDFYKEKNLIFVEKDFFQKYNEIFEKYLIKWYEKRKSWLKKTYNLENHSKNALNIWLEVYSILDTLLEDTRVENVEKIELGAEILDIIYTATESFANYFAKQIEKLLKKNKSILCIVILPTYYHPKVRIPRFLISKIFLETPFLAKLYKKLEEDNKKFWSWGKPPFLQKIVRLPEKTLMIRFHWEVRKVSDYYPINLEEIRRLTQFQEFGCLPRKKNREAKKLWKLLGEYHRFLKIIVEEALLWFLEQK